MNQQAGKTVGVALLLAAALIAALFAQGVFAPPGAGAQQTLTNIIEVDGGRSSEMVFRVNLPSDTRMTISDLKTTRLRLPCRQISLCLPR